MNRSRQQTDYPLPKTRMGSSFYVLIEHANVSVQCGSQQSVLQAMSECGASGIQAGCRRGGCGVCRVQVLSGDYLTGDMSYAHVSPQHRGDGIALACQLYPRTDLRVRVIGRPGGDENDEAARLIRRLWLSSAPQGSRSP